MRCNDAICSLSYNNKQGMNYKQLLDLVFVISGIIKVEVSVISRSLRPRLLILDYSGYHKKSHPIIVY